VAGGERGEARGARDESVGDEIDRLFQLPLDEFTGARKALVAKLKKHNASETAEQVKDLTRPSISAWIVNQLYWRYRKAFDRLLAAGEQFRAAQAAKLAGTSADIRTPLAARRDALAELLNHASAMLRGTGHASSRDTIRRITTTLEALAAYGESRGAPQPGRLTADVDPPGFDALAGLVPPPDDCPRRGCTPTRAIPSRSPKQRPAPRQNDAKEDARRQLAQRRAREVELGKALHDAERRVKDAKRDANTAREQMKTLVARAKEMERRRATLETQLEKAKVEAESARQEAGRAASRAEDAAKAVDDADRAVQRAREALKDL
jgi:hypothetical protein